MAFSSPQPVVEGVTRLSAQELLGRLDFNVCITNVVSELRRLGYHGSETLSFRDGRDPPDKNFDRNHGSTTMSYKCECPIQLPALLFPLEHHERGFLLRAKQRKAAAKRRGALGETKGPSTSAAERLRLHRKGEGELSFNIMEAI